MNDEVIQDLKQFITATVSQQLAVQKREINKRFDEQDEKLDEILNAVGGSIHEVEQKVDKHETRITRLERKLA